MNDPVISEPEQLTAAWLTDALRRDGGVGTVSRVRYEPVGTGQIGACFTLGLTGNGVPERLVAKLPTPDPASRALLGGVYRAEVLFYQQLAGTVAIRTPACHYAAISDEHTTFVLLLEDLFPAVQGDQLVGCTPGQARDCLVNLAGLHGPRWCDPALLELDWLYRSGDEDAQTLSEVYSSATETFIARFEDRLAERDKRTLREVAERIGRWIADRGERFGLVHGDYRLDNLIFPRDGRAGVAAVDWQTLTIGLPARDLAYFLGTCLSVADRRAHEKDLVAVYHRALTGYGVTGYSADLCFDDYRFALLQGPLISVLGCAYGTPSERGDRMFLAMIARCCEAIRDLGSLELVR